MVGKKESRKEHLEFISSFSRSLAEELESQKHPFETIRQMRDLLEKHSERGHSAVNLARMINASLEKNAFTRDNLPQILPVLVKQAENGYNTNVLAYTIHYGLAGKMFTNENLAKILPVLLRDAEKKNDANNLAWTVRNGIKNKVLTEENLTQVLPLLEKTFHKHAENGSETYWFGAAVRAGFENKVFTQENLAQILPVLEKTFHKHAENGHSVYNLAKTIGAGLKNETFGLHLERVLKLLAKHAEKGKNASALAGALQSEILKPTPKTLGELEALGEHALKVYDFLHGVNLVEDHKKTSARVFQHVIKTFKTNPEELKTKEFWSSTRIYAKQLRAFEGNLK
ncbi:hypothetical protein H0N96_00225 [Candidatus Micrarchaeota archaeon]|nr:hypothetical protein [Candidatus Micrarchaeota archaeon]